MLQVKLEPPTKYNSIPIDLGKGKIAVIDQFPPGDLFDYEWRPVRWHFRWYAVSTRRLGAPCKMVSMHRLVANTPPGEVCHHYTKDTLDNRRCNLLNQTPRDHAELHKIRRFGRKHDNIILSLFFFFLALFYFYFSRARVLTLTLTHTLAHTLTHTLTHTHPHS